MLSFILRRLAATLVVLLVASFIVYQLTAISGDPLAELRASRDPDIQSKLAYLSDVLDLDTPPLLRYFLWLGGAAGCLVGQCDLGVSIAKGQGEVTELLAGAMMSTLQLITLATILSILVGVAVGMTTALRQYSGYDYTVTFFAFIFYSLPIFWVAVLLKEYGAIRFNRFLADPTFTPVTLTLVALFLALVVTGIVGGGLKTRVRSFVVSGVLSGAIMTWLNVTQWLKTPSIGLVGVVLLTLVVSGIILLLTTGFGQKRAVIIISAMGLIAGAMWLPGQYLFFYLTGFTGIIAMIAIMAIIGITLGLLFGGDAKREIARAAGIVGAISGLILVIDEAMQYWSQYLGLISIKSGFVSTIGAVTPTIKRQDNLWLTLLDNYAHLILPTAALMIVSVAGYTRYARASLLEVMNQDYIRTARAKGLSERVVVVRHAFRNAMIPIATIIAFDISGLIGGAIITERVFAWEGMGALFSAGLGHVDVNLVMGFFLITGLFAVVGNLVADLLYSSLDPRIRVS
ncbi:MAG: ABC transporter permease [Aquiluna sp.]|nr:ABC transporter permease [Aquiluna sp.]MCF8545311.1 ABC transporter permease [Aquiluna sp.]